MSKYIANQFRNLLKQSALEGTFHLKVIGQGAETKLVSCNRSQVQRIAAAMTGEGVSNEESPQYVTGAISTDDQDAVIEDALAILRKRCERTYIGGGAASFKQWLALEVGDMGHEEFGLLMLDNQHQLIEKKLIAKGTIDGAIVYPREVVKAVIGCGAAAVVFYHNHPSGIMSESNADVVITKRLANALRTIDVRVLDHIIVGGGNSMSFAEKGLI